MQTLACENDFQLRRRKPSVVVPVALVGGVAVAVVHEVGVTLVRHGHVAAIQAMLMGVPLVDRVFRPRALVDVALVHAVDVPVVRVVGVVAVRDRDVAAVGAVDVLVMAGVGVVVNGGGHGGTPRSRRRRIRRPVNVLRH